MEGIGVEVSQKIKSAIKAKLVELGVYVDEELPDYIMVMVANNRSKTEMIDDLQLFLGAHTEKFISWLLQVLQKLQEVTLASLDARKASSSGLDKEKIAKKRKLSVADTEAELAKKDRKKKVEVSKKDTGGKKGKKGLKLKSSKLEEVKPVAKRPDENYAKDKREVALKPKEKTSASVTKSTLQNLPSTTRTNPKPVLMVSDEDDEDFINIRADAEAADLLVSELQEDIRIPPHKQSTVASTSKNSTSGSSRVTDRLHSGSQQSTNVIPVENVVKEPVALDYKDVRLQRADEGGTATKELSSNHGWHRSESQVVVPSSSSHVSQPRAISKSSESFGNRIPSVKRTPAIPISDTGSKHVPSSNVQTEVTASKYSDTHTQPSSKVIPVSRIGSIKSRLGKRPGDREESHTSLGSTRAVGVPSVVRVKGRPKIPLAAQANKNLILKAVAEAQKSVATAPVRVEPRVRSPGLLTRKNRENSSKIAVTLPNPRVSSQYDQEEWSSQDEVIHSQAFDSQPKIMVQLFQNQNPAQNNQQQPPPGHVSGLVHNQAQTIQSQDELIHTQRLLVKTQAQLLEAQNLPNESPAEVMRTPTDVMQSHPQPDLVASLHEGMSSRSSITSANGNVAEDVIMNDENGIISLSQPRNILNSAPTDVEGPRIMEGLDQSLPISHGALRTSELSSYSEGNQMGPTIICSVPEEVPRSIVERQMGQTAKETPVDIRASSPQFFVTLSGYDPCPYGGAGSMVVRSDLGAKKRCLLLYGEDDMEVGDECLDEGIGDEDSKDAMESMGGEREEVMEVSAPATTAIDKRPTHSTGPIIFRNTTTNVSEVESAVKPKISERCRFWPACRHGERCEYHHPTIPCKAFPSCKFGDKCLYIHPNCKFDAACSRKDCPFTHAMPRSLAPVPAPAPVRFPPRPAPLQCKFYPKCTNVNCKFYHPKPCRFGNACNKYDCPFMHEREPIPSKEKLKWVCPAKA
ncbi:zinc finger CCCH domain-containing protein 14 isoform X2 [Ischnura elegans]|uniref:zinc finger CCCH domain-containing protein 14 isoform X2 n=1 Tax=Ischnura elegans TaxID=197161 RepID=UPI001ED8B88C|nr:zinc finger CCCH domain-containing protein 14 isoform X2 [Ischnura elegans]